MPGDSVYDSRAVANYLIGKAGTAGLDSLQVMKLVYIAHGFVLALLDRPLLEDDVEAWQYGPVMRQVYAKLPGGPGRVEKQFAPFQTDLDAKAKEVVDYVFDTFGKLSGLTLSSLTHRNGSPWKKTWDTYGKNAVIPQDMIQRHYKNMIEQAKAAKAEGRPYTPEAL